MNGLTLRINKIGTKRSKNTGFDVIVFSDSTDIQDDHKPYYNSIIQVSTPEEQLSVIKELLKSSQTNYDKVFASILVDVFLQANAKHPIKCFLTRHITKNLHLQEAFTKNLVCKLSKYVFKQYTNYKEYVENVMKIAGCTENFPTGTKALHALEIPLVYFFKDCLESCIKQLRISTDISPTEKSEIFNLTHLTLRLLLQIIQKINKCAVIQLEDIFSNLRSIFMYLLIEHEVPMDTKSLCGIVYLTIHMLENGSDSWLSYLTNQDSPDDAVQLAMLSAIVIIVPINKLESEKVNNLPAIVVLSDKILKIGERSSSESIFILGVSRTVLQISKLLPEITQLQIGLLLVDELLMYVWTHSEHYMDSVRHLAAQTMGCIVKYCNMLQMQGVNKALTQLFTALSTLDRSRKSYYLCVTSLVEVMGSQAVIQRLPDVMEIIVQAVKLQAVQASATTALETIIEKHAQENKQNISEAVIAPLLNRIQQDDVESTELSVLEGVLVKAVKVDSKVMDFILPHIENHSGNLKSVLTLLSVARKANVTEMLSKEQTDSLWKGIISYDVLKQAAVDYQDEVRILSLSLIVNSPKSTETFSRGDLDLILWYLKYNINAQSPNFRQLFLSILKKFMKRFEDSYKVVKRQVTVCQGNKDHYYITFVEELRSFCFDSLLQGTNYSRRFVALQILVWVENIHLEETERIWKETYVEKLLVHLEDSYENNKAMALEVLQHCPAHILQEQTYSTVLDLESILRQASSTKPTDCVSAGYKLVLLIKLLPQNILRDRELCSEPEAVTYTLINILLKKLEEELSICKNSVCDASRRAPMYGVISCVRRCFQLVDTEAISSSALWTSLISSLIKTCLSVCSSVECVVNNTSPEGHLPMDGGIVDDWGNSKGLTLEDGRLVTAQMVLLCAWRSVKEASLLLGDLTSRLSIPESLSYEELGVIEAHFTNLLMNTKHRGAFEQVYVGYTRFLSRIWHCPNSALVSSAQSQLQNILDAIRNKDEGLCATRRSAGLPFMIQALLTTSLTTHNNSKHTNDIMSSLLELSRHPDLSSRSHALNVLRALFRNTELTQSISGFVGEALVVALEGFRSGSWMERNSSTLLFSALMTRTFGVQRSRDPDDLCIRNRMTGRIFFLRYPQLYDYMLSKLSEVSASESQLLRPALYPILLLLARLYPSSLEGTVSNLKLAAFIPHILSCAGSCVLKTRQLAAKAIVPLVAPDQYISHLESMFELLHDKGVNKNLCHGILLQITSLLNAKPDCLTPESVTISRLSDVVQKTDWIVEPEQLQRPCYLILDEYMKVINLLLWRFPSTFTELLLSKIDLFIQSLLFTNKHCPVNSGRDICLANAAYLGFVVMNKYGKMNIAKEFLYKCLEHESYEVNLAALNYLLIAHKSIEPDHCIYQKHLQTIKSNNILAEIKEHEKYLELLCNVLRDNQYLECIRKSLKLLTLQKYTQRHIVAVKSKVVIEITDKFIIQVLFDCIEKEHENLTHIYLQSLTDFVSEKIQKFNLRDIGEELLLKVIRVIFACSSSENNDDIRSVVVDFMERNFVKLVNYEFKELCDVEEFEFKATLLSIIISTLEDDDSCLRERSSKIISKLVQLSKTEVICSKAGEYLREYVVENFGKNYCIALMLILALLDFKSEVCLTDEINDECRVFDQSERYNIYLEETIWTNVCADIIIDLCNKTNEKVVDSVRTITNNKMHRQVIAKLCGTNFILFENILDGAEVVKSDAINPKISLFVKRIIC